jgi:hypothetical protein
MATIEGRERLRLKFQALPGAIRAEVQKAVRTSAEELVGLQKRLAPQDKGALRDSIRYEITEGEEYRATVMAGGTEATKREVRKGSGVFTDEAILKEYGTKPHPAGGKFAGAKIPAEPARPFFFPAYRALRKRIKGRISRAITTGVKKASQR